MTAEIWAVLCATGALVVRAGMALHDSGSLRAKNSVSAILRAVADFCLAALAFWLIGAAIFFGQSGRFLSINTSLIALASPQSPGLIAFAIASAMLASGIVPGVLGERARFGPAAMLSLLIAGLLMPLAGFWVRAGWLGRLGFHDFAGGSFIHLAGAICALVGVIYVGPRLGKYNRDGSSNAIPGHSVPFASAGLLLMIVGSIPAVAGFAAFSGSMSIVGRIALNVLLAAAAAGAGGMVFCHFRYGKPDVHLTYGSILGSLVAVCAGADVLPAWGAVLTGLIAGVVLPLAIISLDLIWKIDDPTSGITLHGLAAGWGILATAIFGPAPSIIARFKFLGIQFLGLLAVAALSLILALALFEILKRVTILRSREADEFDGLDLAEHDIGAYPDFQQNTIKSYHLREA